MNDHTQMVDPATAQDLLIDEVEHHVLRLRELLVRGDENLKAWHLLGCVPYWAETEGIATARMNQREMVLHAIEPQAYAEYYGSNPHDRPMEEQYGGTLTVDNADQFFPRLRLAKQWMDPNTIVIDLSGNDGLMAKHLMDTDSCQSIAIIDLDPRCVARARARGVTALLGNFMIGDDEWSDFHNGYDVALLFETIEHLPDPVAGVREALRYAPEVYISTPLGAVEKLNLPTWAHVERKGHLHSFTPDTFMEVIEQGGGRVEDVILGPDGVMVARVFRNKSRVQESFDHTDDHLTFVESKGDES